MIFKPDSIKPIYVQIAEWLETEILSGQLAEDERVYSQYQLAEMFTINPATAAKGLNLLAEEEIVYKKRGLGMFVSTQAKEYILTKRKQQVLGQMIKDVVAEAQRLGVEEKELLQMMKQAREEIYRGGDGER
ncbi:putative transcriptional regulator [Desulfitobacterium dichloroeliminans LMG P-21439]|uniref:Putative transcriptional regulator n=1 Tax=Desulfitobacterium dichloroeliminans (strain LMG P-21439 / DCA1) TaxID=871963 RepID=L0F5F3_DESDL|nr:GntR family transcriptional regulator [Desulfitobacterium dichloroeliminans]AGA67891.1 putative transcriptional regulator [Desulfitobacterium dichloroeliminans LMG P-21439]